MLDNVLDYFKRQDVEYEENYSIKKDSKVKIGGKAAAVAIPNTEDKLVRTVRYLARGGLKYKVVGAMSNILPKDDYYNGIVVKTSKIDTYSLAEDKLTASCGCYIPALFRRIAALGYGGFAELSSIPGVIGGCIYGNAGAFGKSFADIILNADVYDIINDEIITVDRDELALSYRDSAFKHKPWILLSASLRSVKASPTEALKAIKHFSDIRKETQPTEPSLGSVFKRSGDVPVSLLIDKAGLKGYRVGDAAVSTKHAGFIVNIGNATARDFILLTEIIKKRIFELYGVMLEEEIERLS